MDLVGLIHRRKAARTHPGNHKDGFKIGLVIEGGGMRGVVSGGMVAALEALGLKDCFDTVYGSSGGAINGAYFISGQAAYGTTIYYQNINNQRFIDERNVWRPGNRILSLEFLLDHVCENEKPLDWSRVVESDLPLVVVASSVRDANVKYLRGFHTKSDLKEALRASARIPIVAGPPVPYQGDLFWDAMIFEPVPVRAALQDGCTHIVTLLTRPHGTSRLKRSAFDKLFLGGLIKKRHPNIYHQYITRDDRYLPLLQQLYNGTAELTGLKASALAIAPASSCKEIRSREKRREILAAGAMDGARAVFAAFGHKDLQVIESIQAYAGGHRFSLSQSDGDLRESQVVRGDHHDSFKETSRSVVHG